MKIHTVIGTAMLSLMLVPGFALAAEDHVKDAKEHCASMVNSGKEAINHGEMKHTDEAIKYLKEMKGHTEECYSHTEKILLPAGGTSENQMHGQSVLEHLMPVKENIGEAIKHGNMGHNDELMIYTKKAMKHAVEGNSHAKQLK